MRPSPRHQALRTVWLSDVHLGSPRCRVNLLLDFLRHTRCEQLYLVGDIIDLESLRRSFYWPASHTEVLRLLLKKSQEGTRIVYIPGNHDHDLRALVGMQFGNIEIAREAIHTTRDGRRLLVLHGDQFDAVVRRRVARRLARRLRLPATAHAESLRALAARSARSALLVARAAREGALPRRAALHRAVPDGDAHGGARGGRRRRGLRPHPPRRSHDDRRPRSTATTATGSRAARRSSRTQAASCRCSNGGRRPQRSPPPCPCRRGHEIDSEQEAA